MNDQGSAAATSSSAATTSADRPIPPASNEQRIAPVPILGEGPISQPSTDETIQRDMLHVSSTPVSGAPASMSFDVGTTCACTAAAVSAGVVAAAVSASTEAEPHANSASRDALAPPAALEDTASSTKRAIVTSVNTAAALPADRNAAALNAAAIPFVAPHSMFETPEDNKTTSGTALPPAPPASSSEVSAKGVPLQKTCAVIPPEMARAPPDLPPGPATPSQSEAAAPLSSTGTRPPGPVVPLDVIASESGTAAVRAAIVPAAQPSAACNDSARVPDSVAPALDVGDGSSPTNAEMLSDFQFLQSTSSANVAGDSEMASDLDFLRSASRGRKWSL